MKKISLLILLSVGFSAGIYAQLSAGDIAFTAFNADGDDDFAIVALVDIPANTTLYFTDNEPNSDGTGFLDFNEGTLEWASGGSVITAGTIVVFTDTDNASNPSFGASTGTLSEPSFDGPPNLAGGGDALYAVEGSPDGNNITAWLAGIQNEAGNQGTYFDQTGLTVGTTFINFFSSGSPDGGYYSGARSGESAFPDYLVLLGDNTNWTVEVSNGENILPISTTPFTISSGSTSSESDIVKTSGWSEPTNIDYTLYSATSSLTTSNAIEVGKFTIRDGGSTAPDSDTESTSLTDITFTISNFDNITALAIFDGSSNISEVTSVTSSTAFSGITGLSATDDGTKDFSIYATFKTLVTDNDNLKFTVSSATADPLGSTFAAGNAGGATTDDTGDNNKLVVTADRLAITTPVSVVINTDFAVDIEATDANGSRDSDETSSVTLVAATGTGTLSSVAGLTQSLSSGFYSWTDTQYDVAEDFTIEAQSGTLTDVTSGTITALGSANTDLIISEVADPAGSGNHNARFVELYNAGTSTIDFSSQTWYLTIQVNGVTMTSDQLIGTISSGGTFVTSYSESGYLSAFGFDSDQNTGHNGSGDDGYFLYYNGDHTTGTLVDAFGVIDEDGTGEPWEYTDTKAVRLRSVTTPNTTWTSTEWDIPGSAYPDDMTPSEHNEDVTWAGAGTTADDWHEKGGNWSGTYGYIPDASFDVTVPFTTVSPVISDEAACNMLTLEEDALTDVAVGGELTVYDDLESFPGGRGDAVFTISSSASGNGSVIVKGSATGSAHVQRYFQGYDDGASNGWHNISSPVNNMAISGTGFDPTGTSDDLYRWNESTDTWENYQQGHFSNFANGTGYLCAFQSTETNSFSGTLNTSDVAVSNLTLGGDGWHLLGNPFASAIEWNNGDWALTNVSGTAQIWEESNNSYTVLNANYKIPSTNGFFVEVSSATNSLTIPASARVHSSFNNYKNGNADGMPETLELTITNNENSYYDLSRIGFKDDATLAWDIAFDAHKLFGGSTAPQIWTVTNDEFFAQNYLPYSSEAFTVPLYFKPAVNSTFHIHADGLDSFYENIDIYLEDLFTDKIIYLNEQALYSYTASADDEQDRFLIHFYDVTDTEENMAIAYSKIYTYKNTVYMKFDEIPTDNYNVEVINMVGQQVYAGEFAPGNLNSFNLNEKPGIYFVRLRAENKTVVQKVMISK